MDLFFLFFLKRPKIQKLYIQARRGSMKYTIREKGEDFAPLTKAKGRVANKILQVGHFFGINYLLYIYITFHFCVSLNLSKLFKVSFHEYR